MNLASHISFQICTLLNNALWAMSNLTYCYLFYIWHNSEHNAEHLWTGSGLLFEIPYCSELWGFWKKSLMLTKATFIWSKYSKNWYCEILFQFNPIYIYINIYLKCNLFLWCKAEFPAAITSVFSVTWSYRNAQFFLINVFVESVIHVFQDFEQ